MQPTEVLSSEHRVIEVVLDCLELLTQRALDGGKLDAEAAEKSVDFIRNFADRCHHGKEETHLFVAMTDRGVPREGGPVGQMLHEHEQGRAFVGRMADSITEAASGDSGALSQFAEAADGYVQLLRAHIQKEDNVLFPLADNLLTEDDQRQLSDAFEKVETEHMGEGEHEKYLEIARALAEQFGIEASVLQNNNCGCGH